MTVFWNKIPAPLRTVLNVVLGAGVAAFVTYLTGVVSGGTFDVSLAVQAVLTAVGTALVKALNPVDTGTPGYGVGVDATLGA